MRPFNAALTLVNRDYENPASDDSGEIEEISRLDPESIESPAEAKVMILKYMNMLLEQFQGPQQATPEMVLQNRLAVQELATQILTAASTTPVFVQPQYEPAVVEAMVKPCIAQGYAQAIQIFNHYFQQGCLPQASTGSKLKLRPQARWTCAAFQEHPDLFWSTVPRALNWTVALRTSGVRWSHD